MNRSRLKSVAAARVEKLRQKITSAGALAAAFGLLTPTIASAAGTELDLPLITEVACPVLQWMQGPLGIVIFLCVVVSSLVIGMIAKMQWDRIITVTVILAILVGLSNIVANVDAVSSAAGLSTCLRS